MSSAAKVIYIQAVMKIQVTGDTASVTLKRVGFVTEEDRPESAAKVTNLFKVVCYVRKNFSVVIVEQFIPVCDLSANGAWDSEAGEGSILNSRRRQMSPERLPRKGRDTADRVRPDVDNRVDAARFQSADKRADRLFFVSDRVNDIRVA